MNNMYRFVYNVHNAINIFAGNVQFFYQENKMLAVQLADTMIYMMKKNNNLQLYKPLLIVEDN